jgi:hypothetical protein
MPGVTAGPASPRQILHFVLDYLASIDHASAHEHRQRIDPLLGQDSKWENPRPGVTRYNRQTCYPPQRRCGLRRRTS